MTVTVFYKDGHNECYQHAWEIQDNTNDEFVLKEYDHICNRIPIHEINYIKVENL